jgi:hypothetical protein
MSSTAAPAAPATATAPAEPASAATAAEAGLVNERPTTWGQHTQRFFSRSEMCLQLWPDPTTARGRNTLGLWLVGAPLVVMLLLKAVFGLWPGLTGWFMLLLIAAAFALLGAGFMEWGLSPMGDAADVPRESWIYMGIGGGVLVAIVLTKIGIVLGRATGGRKNAGQAVVVQGSD